MSDSCDCCCVGALCDAGVRVCKVASTPAGRASFTALIPFLLFGAAITSGMTSLSNATEAASCVLNCSCLCSYAYGALALYVLAIQKAYTSCSDTKVGAINGKAAPVLALDANGKVAAKAA